MLPLIEKLGRRIFVSLGKNMSRTHQTLSAQQSREQIIKRQTLSAHSPRVPQLGTSTEQVTRARARAMQGAKSEFAKLMEELNQSREQADVYERQS